MNENISALEVASQFISKFGLSGPKIQDGIRKKIERVCQKILSTKDGRATNLWDASATEYASEENGKKFYRHFFSEADVERMLQNKELLLYLYKRASEEGQKILQEKIDLIAEAERRENEYHEYLANLDHDALRKSDELTLSVSAAQVREREMYIMLEALFLRHFTPLDREQLITDMCEAQLEYTTEYINIIESLKRLEENAYYSKKPAERPAKKPFRRSVKSIKKRQPKGASKRPSKPDKKLACTFF